MDLQSQWRWVALCAGVGLACSAQSAPGTRSGPGGATGGSSGAGSSAGDGIVTSGGGGGGSGGFAGEACAAVVQQAENRLQPADIIWAIDTSGSMLAETQAVRDNLNAFSQLIVASGIDTHIVVIAEYPDALCPSWILPCSGVCLEPPLGVGQCPSFDTNPAAGYWHVNERVSSHDPLSKMLDTYPNWQGLLRKNASKSFVVVSDDNQKTAPVLVAQDFANALASLDAETFADWRFHGVFSFTDCPLAASPGTVYADLVSMTGGVAADLCLQDFQPVFAELATGVIEAAKLDCEWEIPPPPDGSVFSAGRVNVRYTSGAGAAQDPYFVESAASCGPQGGWYYDAPASPTRVVVCPTTCDEIRADPSGRIDLLFGCETIAIPK